MTGGVKGIQYAGYWLVKCPRCKVAPYQLCVALDGSGRVLRSRHEARAVLGRSVKRSR